MKVAWEKGKGFSVCAEIGVGAGVGVELDLDGKVDGDTNYLSAELGYDVGLIGASGKVKYDDCGNLTGDLKGKIGPVELTYNGDDTMNLNIGKSLKDTARNMLKGKKGRVAKLSLTACKGFGG